MSLPKSSNPNNDVQLWQQLKQGSELALGKLIKLSVFKQSVSYFF